MKRVTAAVFLALLLTGMLVLAGCDASGDEYDYRGGYGSAPIGGGCGVAMPSNGDELYGSGNMQQVLISF